MPSHRMATTVAPARRIGGGYAGGRHRGPDGEATTSYAPVRATPASASPGWQPRSGGGHRAPRTPGRLSPARPAPVRGLHRDPRAATVGLHQLVARAASLRALGPPTAAAVRQYLPIAATGLRRLITEPRFALVAAVLAAMVLVTGQAHDRFTGDEQQIPTATSVNTPARAPGAQVPADRGSTRPKGDSAPPAAAEPPRATRPAPSAEPANAGTPGAVPPPGTQQSGIGTATTAAQPTSSTSPRPSGIGPAGSARRTGGTGVALTFDDGPDPVNTPRLLDLLREQNVKATFCVVGSRARAHPDLIRRIATDGHTLCNHSWEHSFSLGLKPLTEIRADLEATNLAIRTAVPDARIGHFRAPGGFFTARLVAVAAEFGMKSQYWEVDPRDWERLPGLTDEAHADKIIRIVQAETRPGSMVLSHDFQQPTTITAYETLIPWLKERFALVALPS